MEPVNNSRRMAATLLDPEPPGKSLDEGRFESETNAFYRRVWQKCREIAARESTAEPSPNSPPAGYNLIEARTASIHLFCETP